MSSIAKTGHDHITLFTEHPSASENGDEFSVPMARFRFNHELGQWTLHYLDAEQRWRFYLNVAPSLDLGRLLNHLEADPLNIFWV